MLPLDATIVVKFSNLLKSLSADAHSVVRKGIPADKLTIPLS